MKDLQFVKKFDSYFVNEDKGDDKPKGPKVVWFNGGASLDEIRGKSQEAYDYILEVTKILKTDPEYQKAPVIKMLFNKKAQVGLSEEAATKLVETFKTDTELKFGDDQFNTVFIDKKPFKTILEENVKLNTLYKEVEAAIEAWNKANAAVFNFDNNVSDKVNNADDSNKALNALKDIFIKYSTILKNVKVELSGHTSTIPVKGDPNGNTKLSEGRASTIKNMLLAVYPEAKDFNITSVGKGEKEPIFPDDKGDTEKQNKNRRVEAKIITETQPEAPEEKTTYNVVIYGFVLTEMDEQKKKVTQGTVPKRKGGFKPLDKKKAIPCPHFK